MYFKNSYKIAAFTLLELSIVVVILSLVAAASLRHIATLSDANNTQALNQTMDVVDKALLNYSLAYNRLPCPADPTSKENASTFGTEIFTAGGTVGDGTCGTALVSGSWTTTGNLFLNTATDPDNPTGGSDPYAVSETNYDPSTLNQVVAGAIPTRALNIDDKYAYDPWGRKILYVIDKRMTAFNAFTTYPVYSSGPTTGTIPTSYLGANTIGAIVIKSMMTDSTGCAAGKANAASKSCLKLATTSKAVYALVSFGKDGHGGYVRNPTATSVPYNAGSTNADELKNCHCSSSAAATAFDRIFVQKPITPNTTPGAGFDDIVRFKNRAQIIPTSALQ